MTILSHNDGLDINSPMLIDFPALCIQCGEATTKTANVTIDKKTPAYLFLLYLIRIPGIELIVSALESRKGPRTTKVPYCKTCNRPRFIAGWKAFALALPVASLPLLFAYGVMTDLPYWFITIAMVVATVALFCSIVLWNKIQKLVPVKIRQDKRGYHYHFAGGAYREWARSHGL